MPWSPEVPGERPTLGAAVVEWVETMLGAPEGAEGLVRLTREQIAFCLKLYELDVTTGGRRYRRAVLSRAKGWGRSPFLAMLACAEAFADVVPDGWDANGRPVGKPWSKVRTPWVQVLAVSEDQTRNAWAPLLGMLGDGPAANIRGVDILQTFVVLPGGGRIEFTTASAVSREGNRPVFAVLDQTESWTEPNGGKRLAAAVRRNLGKTGGCSVESPNAWRPGYGSVAEASAEYHRLIEAGRATDDGLLWDHREAPPATDLADPQSLLCGLRYAYGDSADHPDGCVLHDPPCAPGWVPLERIQREIADPDTDVADSRQYYLNMPSAAETSWLAAEEWAACASPKRVETARQPVGAVPRRVR